MTVWHHPTFYTNFLVSLPASKQNLSIKTFAKSTLYVASLRGPSSFTLAAAACHKVANGLGCQWQRWCQGPGGYTHERHLDAKMETDVLTDFARILSLCFGCLFNRKHETVKSLFSKSIRKQIQNRQSKTTEKLPEREDPVPPQAAKALKLHKIRYCRVRNKVVCSIMFQHHFQ